MKYPFTIPAITIEKGETIVDGENYTVYRGTAKDSRGKLVCISKIESVFDDYPDTDHHMEQNIVLKMLAKLREESGDRPEEAIRDQV